MFSIYKKELQSFFYTPFAYIITALFMFLFTLMFNNALGNIDHPVFQFTFPDIFYNVIFFFIHIMIGFNWFRGTYSFSRVCCARSLLQHGIHESFQKSCHHNLRCA